MSELRHQFEKYCHDLDTKAQQLRQGTQIAKATGIASTVLGAAGLISTGLGALPVAIGLCIYGFGVIREKSNTGRFQPLPWSQESGGVMAAGAIQHGDVFTPDFVITDYDHLSQDDKADYTLFAILAPVIVPLIENATPIQQERWLTGARRTLIKYHSDIIADPEAMASSMYGSLQSFRGAFARNLPEDMQQRIAPEVLASAGDRRDLLADHSQPVAALPVGQETRLGAVDVEAMTVSPQSALDVLVNNAAVSRGIYGGQRTGKSYLCAVASRERAKAKGTKTFFINLNAFDAEDGYYWQHAHKSLMVNLHIVSEEVAAQHIKAAIALVAEFQATSNALLIIDEWSSCGSKTMAHQALMESFTAAVACANNAVSPTAIKRKQAIWLLTPSIVATEMIQAAKTIKSLQPMIVAIAPGHDVFYEGSRLTFDSILYQQVSQNYSGMIAAVPSSFSEPRMVQLDGQWVPVGVTGRELDSAKGATTTPTAPAVADDFSANDLQPPQQPLNSWSEYRAAVGSELGAVMDWIEKQDGSFEKRKLSQNKTVRQAIEGDVPVVLEWSLSALQNVGLIKPVGNGAFIRSNG